MKKIPKTTLIAITAVSMTAGALNAQDSDEDVFELSPFEVDASNDTGYRAGSTLAGTRLSTSLKDVGASLSVLTDEFLDDLGVDDFSEAFDFTPSAGTDEGAVGDGAGNGIGGGAYGIDKAIRIRGFGSNASSFKNFFETYSDGDRYNSERFTVVRGPNSLLFGVGDAAGATVSTVKRGLVHKNKTSVQFQIDNNGSKRGALDHNQVLVEDKLAFRVNYLNEAEETYNLFKEASERVTLSASWKPTKKTSVDLLYEDSHREVNNVAMKVVQPVYFGYPAYAGAGSPTVDFINNGVWNKSNDYVDADGNPVLGYDGTPIDNKNDFYGTFELLSQSNFSQAITTGLPGIGDTVFDFNKSGVINKKKAYIGKTAFTQNYRDPENDPLGISTDFTGFAYSKKRPQQVQDNEWKQIFITHEFTENLFVEYAYNQSETHREFEVGSASSARLQIDPNKYLPSGVENPGYMQAYVVNGMAGYYDDRESEDHRLTASYVKDFTLSDGWSRWLGSHSISGMAAMNENRSWEDRLKMVNAAVQNDPKSDVSGKDTLSSRTYIIDGQIGEINTFFDTLDRLDEVNAQYNVVDYRGEYEFQIEPRSFWDKSPTLFESNTQSFGWQGRFFGNRLVSLLGYRVDDVDYFDGGARLKTRGVTELAKDIPILDERVTNARGISRTHGFVYHATDWVSLGYNSSENFTPPDASYVSLDGEPLQPSTGTGKDYSLRFYLLQDKLTIEANYYEVEKRGTSKKNKITDPIRNILQLYRDKFKDGSNLIAEDLGEGISYPIAYFADVQGENDLYPEEHKFLRENSLEASDGVELSMTYNPNNKWRMYFSASKNEYESLGKVIGVREFYETPTMYNGYATHENVQQQLELVASGQNSTMFPEFDANDENHRDYANTYAETIEDALVQSNAELENEEDLVGVAQSRNGKYNANAVVTRSFREGSLKGFNVSVNARYRSKPVIGYIRQIGPDGVKQNGNWDLTQPYSGPEYYTFGASIAYSRKVFDNRANMKVQLTITNLLDDTSMRLRGMGHDVNAFYGTQNELVPTLFERDDPRAIKMNVTFDF